VAMIGRQWFDRSEKGRKDREWRDAPAWAKDLNAKLDRIIRNQERAMTTLTDLENGIRRQKTVIDSVETLVTNLVGQIRQAGGDQEKIAAILAEAEANTTRLGAMVAAGTPANTEAVKSEAAPEVTQ